MKKNFVIIILVMIILGLVAPKIVYKSVQIFSGGKDANISSGIINSEYKENINEIKNNELLPQKIKSLLDKIFFFV